MKPNKKIEQAAEEYADGKKYFVTAELAFKAGAEYAQQFKAKWVSVEERLPNLIKDKDYSENVWAWCDGELKVMNLCYMHDHGYAWADCYGDINGDGEFDGDYKVTHWQPFPKYPSPPTEVQKGEERV